MVLTFNFGFVPGTLSDDGDPLDILIVNEVALACGCLMQVALVGVIQAKQREEKGWVRNDRVIAEAVGEDCPPDFEELKLNDRMISNIEFFFTSYNQLYGKPFKILGVGGRRKALQIVQKAAKRAAKKK